LIYICLDLPVWIKYGFKSVEQSGVQLNNVDVYDNLAEVSFGFLTSNISYARSEGIADYYHLQWQTNTREKYLAIRYKNNELRLIQDCLMKYFIISTAYPGIYMIILPLKAPPRCYLMPRDRGHYYERTLTFGLINASCLTDSSAICLLFCSQHSLSACAEFLNSVMNLDCHNGPVTSNMAF
jgi:hypothetical protein